MIYTSSGDDLAVWFIVNDIEYVHMIMMKTAEMIMMMKMITKVTNKIWYVAPAKKMII